MTTHKDIKTWHERLGGYPHRATAGSQRESAMVEQIADLRAYAEQVERERDALREQLQSLYSDIGLRELMRPDQVRRVEASLAEQKELMEYASASETPIVTMKVSDMVIVYNVMLWMHRRLSSVLHRTWKGNEPAFELVRVAAGSAVKVDFDTDELFVEGEIK